MSLRPIRLNNRRMNKIPPITPRGGAASEPLPPAIQQPVSPLRYLAVAGFVVVVIGALALSSLYRSSMTSQWVNLARSHSIDLAQALGVSMRIDLETLTEGEVWGAPASDVVMSRLDDTRLTRMRQQVLAAAVTLPLLKVILYDSYGHVVFSSALSEVGDDDSKNPRFAAALSGEVVSDFTPNQQFVFFDQVRSSDAAFATYVPLYGGVDGHAVIGVIEIYQDMAPQLASVENEVRRVLVWGVAILVGFYGLILLAGYSLGTILQRQHRVMLDEIAERRDVEAHLRVVQNDMEKTIARRTRSQRESEARFRDFAETASDWLWETDASLRFTFVTEGVRRILDLEPSAVIGRQRRELAMNVVESPEIWRAHQDDLVNRRPFRDFRYTIRLANGANRYISVSGMPIIDDGGIFRGYRGTGADLTRQQQAELHITRLGRILDQSINKLFILDADTLAIQQANQRAQQTLGYDAEALSGMSMLSLLGDAPDAETVRLAFNQQLLAARYGQERQAIFETSLRRCDGDIFPVEMRLQYVGHEKPPVMIAVVEDITARKQAEQALAESEARFQSIAEMSLDAIVVHVDGKIVYANSRGVQLAAAPDLGAMINRRIEDFIHPDDLEATYEGLALTTANGTISRGEVRLRRLDGAVILAERSSSAIIFGGRPAVQTVIRDVTQQKAVQAQLIQTAKLATLGEMAAGMAHELSQPMNVIRMAAEGALLERPNSAKPWPDVARSLEIIASQAARMGEIIDHMRIFSRKEPDSVETFDPALSVSQAVNMVEAQFLAEDIGITVRYPTGRHGVQGHPVHLEQVLLNLLTNARDAVRSRMRNDLDAGVADVMPGRISVETIVDIPARVISISIQDNGGGIPASHLDRVFEPFYTTKEVGTGTGLGLSVSFGLITAMKGTLCAENRDDGARFNISLPLIDDAGIADRPVEPPSDLAPLPLIENEDDDEPSALMVHILVVDDEPFATKLLSDHLTMRGYRVTTASDGEEAYARFLDDPPDLVISDLRMPRCDGDTLMRRIHDHLPDLPVILVTGHLGHRDEAGVHLRSEAAGLLKKPISLLELSTLIATILEG